MTVGGEGKQGIVPFCRQHSFNSYSAYGQTFHWLLCKAFSEAASLSRYPLTDLLFRLSISKHPEPQML